MSPIIFNLSCLWVTRSASRSGHLILGTRAPGTYCMVGWVGPRAFLDALEKRQNPCPLSGIETRFLGFTFFNFVTLPITPSHLLSKGSLAFNFGA